MPVRTLDDLGQRVLVGVGSLGTVAGEFERLGSARVLIVASRSLAKNTPVVKELETALSDRHAGTFIGIGAHTPAADVEDAVAKAKAVDADGLLSVGGGAVIDGTKHVVAAHSMEFTEAPARHIAVPTTLSAAEFTQLAGITRDGMKTGISDTRVIPDVAILDPEAAAYTPRWLWAATGVRALDHAIEGVLTNDGDALVDSMCLEAVAEILDALPAAVANDKDLEATERCQVATWRSSVGITRANAGAGLSHKLGKALGATYNIPHGVTSAITMPAVLRHMAGVEPGRFAKVAGALGVADGDAAAVRMTRFFDELGIERKPLREYGVKEADLPKAATYAVGEPRPEVVGLLRALW